MTLTTKIRHQTVCPLCEGNVIYIEALEAFKKEMIEKTIPEIIEAVRQRQQLAAQYVKDNQWM